MQLWQLVGFEGYYGAFGFFHNVGVQNSIGIQKQSVEGDHYIRPSVKVDAHKLDLVDCDDSCLVRLLEIVELKLWQVHLQFQYYRSMVGSKNVVISLIVYWLNVQTGFVHNPVSIALRLIFLVDITLVFSAEFVSREPLFGLFFVLWVESFFDRLSQLVQLWVSSLLYVHVQFFEC